MARASARRMVPDSIVVSVVARPPVALARRDGALVTIDRAGTVLGPFTGRALSGMDDFPIVDGETPEEIGRGVAFVSSLSEGDPALFRHLSEVKAGADGIWVFDKVARTRLLVADAGAGAAASAWRAFLALRPELESRGLLSGEADLRFENRIVLKAPPSAHGST